MKGVNRQLDAKTQIHSNRSMMTNSINKYLIKRELGLENWEPLGDNKI